MEKRSGNIQRRVVVATLCSLLLVAAPVFASERESRAGSILTRITERLCEVQRALGNRLPTPLIDPARCLPPPPPPVAPTLKLVKSVVNDNGGAATTTDFQAKIDGGSVPWNVAQTLAVGSHTASEVTLAGYSASSWGGDCAANGTITLAAGENKTCTITNDDIAQAPTTGHLIVDKVTQPSGSSVEFNITLSGSGTITGGGAGTTTDATSRNYEVAPGTYSATEATSSEWIQVSNTCTDVAVAAGETKTCTITNAMVPTLTVMKVVTNDNSGIGTTTDFTLLLDGVTVTSGVATTTSIGAHVVSEGAHAGYSSAISGDCATDGSITLAAGDNKTCVITNNDDAPQQTLGHLVISEVYYDVSNSTTTPKGSDPTNEWVEIFNGTNGTIDLSGYTVNDSSNSDTIPDGTMLSSGERLLIFATSTTSGFWSIPADAVVVVLSSNIGNGLANGGARFNK